MHACKGPLAGTVLFSDSPTQETAMEDQAPPGSPSDPIHLSGKWLKLRGRAEALGQDFSLAGSKRDMHGGH